MIKNNIGLKNIVNLVIVYNPKLKQIKEFINNNFMRKKFLRFNKSETLYSQLRLLNIKMLILVVF